MLDHYTETCYQRAQRKYKSTPRGKYIAHKINAKQKGIAFEISFDEWWEVWQKSGFWSQRGNKKGDYGMLRIGDTGPYKSGNVFIGPIQRRY